MYQRFFALGCSFTRYHWPTWADILGKEFGSSRFYNLAQPAAGNEYIFHSLTGMQVDHKLTNNDLVIVQWSNFAREDRYLDGAWRLSGNIFTQKMYPADWVDAWFDLRGALIKSLDYLVAASHLLTSVGCKWQYHTMMPLYETAADDPVFADFKIQDLIDRYRPYLNQIPNSIVQYLYDSLPRCRNPMPILTICNGKQGWDHHPSPAQHLKYLQDRVLPRLDRTINISESTLQWTQQWENRVRADNGFLVQKI